MKKPPADPKTCGSCESYKPVNPGDEAGFGEIERHRCDVAMIR